MGVLLGLSTSPGVCCVPWAPVIVTLMPLTIRRILVLPLVFLPQFLFIILLLLPWSSHGLHVRILRSRTGEA